MPILALALCLASGYLLIATAWPRPKPSPSEMLMKLSLSAGFGLGIFSAVFFVVRLLGLTRLIAVDTALLLLLLVACSLRRSRAAHTPGHEYEDFDPPPWVRRTLTASFLIAVAAAVYNGVLRSIAHPHGDGWDAFSIWNLHARFLFLSGDHWPNGFSSRIPWSHPDYPLLVPAAIAHFWSYLGHDDPLVPAVIGLIFTFSTLALLVSSLVVLRGSIAAMLAGLVLSSTPFFVEQGTSQYADLPLSFFILASLVLLNLAGGGSLENRQSHSGSLVLSGLAAGFAAWTKNEGVLFLVVLVLAQAWVLALRPLGDGADGRASRSWRVMARFLLGAAPVLGMLVCFKRSVGTPGDLFSSPRIMLGKVLTPGRYWIILQWFAKEFLRFGNWWIVPGTVAMLAFELLTSGKRGPRRELPFLVSAISLGLMLSGYFVIYVITPRDLYWHLRFSLNRLFLQLWPSAIFLFFLFTGGRQVQLSPISPQNRKL
jgi:hypothetical protein